MSRTETKSAPETSASVQIDAFKKAFRDHPAGVSVITADAGDGPAGLTATSLSSVSSSPAIVAFSVSALSSSTPTILASDTVVIHLLHADHLELARLCATSGVDRFADQESWFRLETGEPAYRDVRARMRCTIIDRLSAGMATIVVAEILDIDFVDETLDLGATATSPLVYNNGAWHTLGDHSVIRP